MLVDELGSFAARIAIPSGLSPLALALDISDNTAESLRDMRAADNISALALIKPDMSFLLDHTVSHIMGREYMGEAHLSSESVMEKLLGSDINWPYLRRYFAQVA